MPFFYAVANGKRPGVYRNWPECKEQVDQYPKARFKKFPTYEEAQKFIDDYNYNVKQKFGKHDKLIAVEVNIKSNHDDQTAFAMSLDFPPYSFKSTFKKQKTSKTNELGENVVAAFNAEEKKIREMNAKKSHAIVYTDGACSNNGYNGAKAGIGVYWGPGDERNLSQPLSGRQTNNRAEIKAATEAIKQAKEQNFNKITVRTDSEFMIKSTTQWIKNWERNGWKKSDGGEVVNKDDFIELRNSMNGIDVEFEKVPAHSGVRGNEEADRLANQALLM